MMKELARVHGRGIAAEGMIGEGIDPVDG